MNFHDKNSKQYNMNSISVTSTHDFIVDDLSLGGGGGVELTQEYGRGVAGFNPLVAGNVAYSHYVVPCIRLKTVVSRCNKFKFKHQVSSNHEDSPMGHNHMSIIGD